MLVWTDLETTGIDPAKDIILEAAVVVTDDDLNEIGHYTSLVIEENPARFIPRGEAVTRANDPEEDGSSFADKRVVYDAHFDNGLVTALCVGMNDDPFPSLRHVQEEIVIFLNGHGVHEGLEMKDRPPLAGATISFDRGFLSIHMPKVLNLLHYRNVDVSTVRELANRWWPALPTPEKIGAHRALGDIRESIDLLRYYREKEFVCGS